MSFIRSKEESLKQLRRFCNQSKIVGMCSHMWFYNLVKSYPLHLLLYTQFSTSFKGTRENAKTTFLKKIEFKLSKILNHEIDEYDIQKLESILEELSEILKTKESTLNN